MSHIVDLTNIIIIYVGDDCDDDVLLIFPNLCSGVNIA